MKGEGIYFCLYPLKLYGYCDDLCIVVQAFAGQIEVHNYPMKARQKSEVEELVMSQEQRRIQLAEFQVS